MAVSALFTRQFYFFFCPILKKKEKRSKEESKRLRDFHLAFFSYHFSLIFRKKMLFSLPMARSICIF